MRSRVSAAVQREFDSEFLSRFPAWRPLDPGPDRELGFRLYHDETGLPTRYICLEPSRKLEAFWFTIGWSRGGRFPAQVDHDLLESPDSSRVDRDGARYRLYPERPRRANGWDLAPRLSSAEALAAGPNYRYELPSVDVVLGRVRSEVLDALNVIERRALPYFETVTHHEHAAAKSRGAQRPP